MDNDLSISWVTFDRRLDEECEDERNPRSEPRNHVDNLLERQRWVCPLNLIETLTPTS
jgi:hypothetical protein